MPLDRKISFIHFGDCLTLIFLTTRPENWLHLSVREFTINGKFAFCCSFVSTILAFKSNSVSISRATFFTLYKSLLLASNFKSKITSSKPRSPKTLSSPTTASSGNISIPFVCSSLKNFDSTPSSNKEQSIPCDS